MATRNRNRTQRKNKNKNKSRRNKQGGGGMTCSEARQIAKTGSGVKKIMAQTKLRVECRNNNTENISGVIAPNEKWGNTRINSGKYKKCNAGYNPDGMTCRNGAEPHLPNDFEEVSSPRPH